MINEPGGERAGSIMDNGPTVSVVLPVHNGERWIRTCVESLLDQTRPAHEIIVVDDASTDETLARLDGLPVRIVPLPANRGRAGARNAGLGVVLGEIVVFAEDDGVYTPAYLERVTAPFVDDAVAGSMGPYRVYRPESFIQRCRDTERLVHYSNYEPWTGWAYRAADVRSLGGFDETLESAEDVDLGRRIRVEFGRIAYVPDALWYHREPAHLGTFLRRRYRAGAGNVFYRKRTGRPIAPARAVLVLVALLLGLVAAAVGARFAGARIWLPALAILAIAPLALRARFIARAKRLDAHLTTAIGWVYMEIAGSSAAAIGSLHAIVRGPARIQRSLRGR
jgi:glycosyltransferase involved in cell wall biosynthesis